MPIGSEPVEHPLNVLPALMRNCMPVFICEIHRVHHFAVNIELQLLVSGISDANRSRVLVARKMIERDLIKLLSPIKTVHHLEWTTLCVVAQSVFQPVDERFGFVDEA